MNTDDYGSLVAELEGVRDSLIDAIADMRKEIEEIKLKIEILEERLEEALPEKPRRLR